jgi:hypothetical protein
MWALNCIGGGIFGSISQILHDHFRTDSMEIARSRLYEKPREGRMMLHLTNESSDIDVCEDEEGCE